MARPLWDALNTAYAFQLYDILAKNGLNKGDYSPKSVGATFKRLAASAGRQKCVRRDPQCAVFDPCSEIWPQGHGSGIDSDRSLSSDCGILAAVLSDGQSRHAREISTGLHRRPALVARSEEQGCRHLVAGRTAQVNAGDCSRMLCAGLTDLPRMANSTWRAQFEGGTPNPPEKYVDFSYYQKALAGL